MHSGLITFIGFVVVFFSSLIWPKLKNKRYLITLITVGVVAMIVSWQPPEPLLYKLGDQEYIAESGDIVKSAENSKIYFWKPDGEVRSYSVVYDTLEWLSAGTTLPGAKIVFAMKGSPSEAERLYALRDSVANPLDTLRNELRSKPEFNRLRAVIMRYDPAIRPVSASFVRPRWSRKAQTNM